MLEPVNTDLDAWITEGILRLQRMLDSHQAFIRLYGP
jgi:hypothetical protein